MPTSHARTRSSLSPGFQLLFCSSCRLAFVAYESRIVDNDGPPSVFCPAGHRVRLSSTETSRWHRSRKPREVAQRFVKMQRNMDRLHDAMARVLEYRGLLEEADLLPRLYEMLAHYNGICRRMGRPDLQLEEEWPC